MYNQISKRAIDFILSFIALLFFFPLLIFLVFSLLVVHGRGGVFFRQNRTGFHGKVFQILKFKTMTDARDVTGKLLPDHERLTGVGSFLRKTSLDELPQLFNVLRGEMSLVGPRPLLPKYLPLYSATQNRRHEVRPGITGWAQVNGRNAISWAKKFELDVYYVDHQSFWLDVKILWMTVEKVLKRKDITTENPQQFQPFNGSN